MSSHYENMYFSCLLQPQLDEMVKRHYHNTPEIELQRHMAVKMFSDIVKKWMSIQGRKTKADCRILPVGAYKLDCLLPGDALELVCLATRHLEDDKFFNGFTNYLKRKTRLQDVTLMRKVIFSPATLQVKIDGVEIQLRYLRLENEDLPRIMNVRNCRCFDRDSIFPVYYLNRVKSDLDLLSMVPDRNVFLYVLKIVKLWAKGCHIFNDSHSFFGHYVLSLLVAKTCIEFANLPKEETLLSFYSMYANWNPEVPVQLIPDGRVTRDDDSMTVFSVYENWNLLRDTHPPTVLVFLEQVRCGYAHLQGVIQRNCTLQKFINARDFFSYDTFIRVKLTSPCRDSHIFWHVETKIFLYYFMYCLQRDSLINFLELNPDDYVSGYSTSWYFGLKEPLIRIDIDATRKDFIAFMKRRLQEVHRRDEEMNLEINLFSQDQLSENMEKEHFLAVRRKRYD